ncbi:prepilin peptidase [Paenibacillus ihumii]|uniref:prepilin peptidase n=1 Tax=Paenibacillus ihumii TaxID=687436 RepID=UPI0006D7DAD1|nr:A24 family peptidase [Paenibacillus ihumii]
MKIWFAAGLILLLLICSINDIRSRIIPNRFVIMLSILGLLHSWLYFSLADALLGILIPSVLLFLIRSRWNFHVGAGDIKLLSAIGAWVGWYANIYVLLAGSVLALIYVGGVCGLRHRKVASVPFAPFLSAAAILIYLGVIILQLNLLP